MTFVTENYLDLDVAYLLGLIVMRGTLYESADDFKVVIEFPYKSLTVEGYEQDVYLKVGVNAIRDRIQELVETPIKVVEVGSSVVFSIRFLWRTVTWRNLRYHFGDKTSFYDFEIPGAIFNAPVDHQREFIRGIADVGGFIRNSNRDQRGRHRVYLEVNNQNWLLPIQLCKLLQQHLQVSVANIQWGHPNTRDAYNRGQNWAKEHQIRIYADGFLPVGFHVPYKQDILARFAEQNKQDFGDIQDSLCNPHPDRRTRHKPPHEGENDARLPEMIRGKHFDSYWQVCLGLGCEQADLHGQLTIEDADSDD